MLSRIAALSRRRLLGAPVGDLAVAVLLAGFAFVDTVFTEQLDWLDQWRGPRPVNGVVVPVAALLLAWRRRYPLLVLTGTFAALTGLGLAYGSTQASITVFTVAIAVYSAAAYGRQLAYAVAVAAVGVWLRDALDPDISSLGDRLWDWLFVGIFFGIGLATRRRHERLAAVEEQARVEQASHKARVEEAAEAERRRIARELHDIVSHSLGVLIFQAGVGEQLIDQDPAKAREAFQSIRLAGVEAIGEMTTILGLIRGAHVAPREPQPRAADVESLVRKARDAGVAVEFGVHGQPEPLPAAVELSVFRVAQEGLTNAMKHAPSAVVRLEVRYQGHGVEVEVVNDGGPIQAGSNGGYGLIGLGERVAIFGGSLDVGPRPEGGWRLLATLPVAR